MQNYGSDVSNGGSSVVSEHHVDVSDIDKIEKVENLQGEKGGGGGQNSGLNEGGLGVITVIISNEGSCGQVSVIPEPGSVVLSTEPSLNSVPVVPEPKGSTVKKDERADAFPSPKKGSLSRSESAHEQCRVCQQQMEEPLIDLGCQCRGGLAKAHRSCIDTWFHTRGSNRCEICQQVATNVSPPESQQSRNYWVWRIDPTVRRSGLALERERVRLLWSSLGSFLDSHRGLAIGCSNIYFSWCLRTSCEHHNRCSDRARTWDCASPCTRMLP